MEDGEKPGIVCDCLCGRFSRVPSRAPQVVWPGPGPESSSHFGACGCCMSTTRQRADRHTVQTESTPATHVWRSLHACWAAFPSPHGSLPLCCVRPSRVGGGGGEYEIMGGDVRKSVSQSWRLQRPQRGHARATTCDRDRSGHTHARANLNNEKTCATSTPPESNTAPSAATRTAPLGQWAGEAAANQRVGPASI